MFDLSPSKLLVLAAVGFIVLGPEKLPEYVRQAAQMLRTLKAMADKTRSTVTADLGPAWQELKGLDPRPHLDALSPRANIQSAVGQLLGQLTDDTTADPRTTSPPPTREPTPQRDVT